MSAVHQAMMSRYGDREHPMPVLLDQLSGGETGSESLVRKEEACFISVKAIHGTGEKRTRSAGQIPYLCKSQESLHTFDLFLCVLKEQVACPVYIRRSRSRMFRLLAQSLFPRGFGRSRQGCCR